MIQEFALNLLSTGRVELTSAETPSDEDVQQATVTLAAFEPQFRDELPGNPPEFDARVATEGLRQFYQACQFHTYRFLGEQELQSRLNPNFSPATTASAHYSVDLIFRFLPDLVQTVRAASTDDPLLETLLRWAAAAPLSSVGIMEIHAALPEPILTDACLTQVYVDRILKHQDASRLNDERVRNEVRRAIGAFPELAGSLLQHLSPDNEAATSTESDAQSQ